jgi:hypothetical protein
LQICRIDKLSNIVSGFESAYYIRKTLMNKVESEEYDSKGATYGSIVDFLNKFYSTAQYRVIPIDKAARWFHLSSNGGMAVKEVDDFATGMLKFYTENPPTTT